WDTEVVVAAAAAATTTSVSQRGPFSGQRLLTSSSSAWRTSAWAGAGPGSVGRAYRYVRFEWHEKQPWLFVQCSAAESMKWPAFCNENVPASGSSLRLPVGAWKFLRLTGS